MDGWIQNPFLPTICQQHWLSFYLLATVRLLTIMFVLSWHRPVLVGLKNVVPSENANTNLGGGFLEDLVANPWTRIGFCDSDLAGSSTSEKVRQKLNNCVEFMVCEMYGFRFSRVYVLSRRFVDFRRLPSQFNFNLWIKMMSTPIVVLVLRHLHAASVRGESFFWWENETMLIAPWYMECMHPFAIGISNSIESFGAQNDVIDIALLNHTSRNRR